MSTATLISIEQYLATHYLPDYDYVDGEILDRNVGEREHSFIQRRLIVALDKIEAQLGISTWPEVRVQVSPTRFRVPDLCVYRGPGPRDSVFHQPPFLCIEILSPEDRMTRMQAKLDDYFAFGVEYVWVVDPVRRAASIHTAAGSNSVRDGLLRTANPDIAIALDNIFPGRE
jgi:Uma2 family endonuclease